MIRSRAASLSMMVLVTEMLCASCQSSTAGALDTEWPNEPSGFQVINDYGFDDPIPIGNSVPIDTSGWFINNGDGDASRFSDGSARRSPANVLRFSYPKGFVGGSAPATMWYDFAGPWPRELYVGFWLKISNPWQGHSSSVNKIGFITTGGTQNALIPELFGQAAPYQIRIAIFELGVNQNQAYQGWLDPNVKDVVPTLGVWHRIEIYAKYGTNSSSYNGTVKLWMDGTLLTSYSDINFNHTGFDGWKFSPTWGGTGDAKKQNDYFEIDHVHTSRK